MGITRPRPDGRVKKRGIIRPWGINDASNTKAFYLHDMPINQDAPEWNNYRLSMSRMKSIQDVSTPGEPLVIFQPMAWTTAIIGECS